jgi:excisionase family DNA binding protein
MTQNELTTEQAADMLQVTARTIRNLIKRGSLRARKVDPNAKSVYRVSRQDVEKLRSQLSKPAPRKR